MAALLILASLVPAWAQAADKPSFDCSKAKSIAEKAICADPALAADDAAIAKNYSAAVKKLGARERKALKSDQQDFVSARDRIAENDEGQKAEDKALPGFMHDRADMLARIDAGPDGYAGTWQNVSGAIIIKQAGGKLDVTADTADPVNGGGECALEETVKSGAELKVAETDADGKATGRTFVFRRQDGALLAEEQLSGDDTDTVSSDCGANGHVAGTFFFLRAK